MSEAVDGPLCQACTVTYLLQHFTLVCFDVSCSFLLKTSNCILQINLSLCDASRFLLSKMCDASNISLVHSSICFLLTIDCSSSIFYRIYSVVEEIKYIVNWILVKEFNVFCFQQWSSNVVDSYDFHILSFRIFHIWDVDEFKNANAYTFCKGVW